MQHGVSDTALRSPVGTPHSEGAAAGAPSLLQFALGHIHAGVVPWIAQSKWTSQPPPRVRNIELVVCLPPLDTLTSGLWPLTLLCRWGVRLAFSSRQYIERLHFGGFHGAIAHVSHHGT